MAVTINADNGAVSGSAGLKYSADNSGVLQLLTNGTVALTVNTSQNVGIGTSSPANLLTVQTTATGTTAGSNIIARLQSNATGRAATLQFSDNVTNSATISMVSGATAFGQNGTEAMRIDSSGNVGIGTTSPSQRLHVGSGAIQLDNDRDIQWGASEAAIRSTSSNLRFSISSTERMRIDSSGNLLVGTTSGSYNTISSGNGYAFNVIQTTTNNSVVRFDAAYSTGTLNYIAFYAASTYRGAIQFNGTSVLYTTSSDYRLKESIAPMTGALAKVALLKPCTYKWKVDGSDGQGFIAHELDEVVPGCVTGEKDAVDANGNPQYQGVDTSFLVATLTAAIQEQQALITALTARITALETQSADNPPQGETP